MSNWRFILTDRNGTKTIVPQPINWRDPSVAVSRDTENGWHGIFFDYGIEALKFDGLGAAVIKSEYETFGVNGEMSIDIEFMCSEDNRYDMFYENGHLAFDQFQDTCGDECTVTIGLEDSGDVMLFRNNYEQKVNINSNLAFDQSTLLQGYDKLNFDLEIPSRGLVTRSEAKSGKDIVLDFFSLFGSDWQHMSSSGSGTEEGALQVLFIDQNDIIINELNDGANFSTYPFYYHNADPGDLLEITQVPINAGTAIACRPGKFNVIVSSSGQVVTTGFGDHTFRLRVTVKKGQSPSTSVAIGNQWAVDGQFNGNQTHNYSINIETAVSLDPGDYVWIYYFITYVKNGLTGVESLNSLQFTQNAGARIFMEQTLICEPSKTKAYLINETASRIVEAITNDKVRFYSNTFGRKDSQPYSVNADSCGGLMALTNGLNLRRKLLKNGAQPGFFVTMKQMFEYLNPIWNIGLTLEPDPNRIGFKRLRFEDWRFFYQNDVAIRFPYATNITRKVDTNRLYNRVVVGYNKWEAGGTTGLDELMTKRTYRININSISKELNITTDLICSPYTIEITRKQDTTTEDWQYDNDVFGFCLKKIIADYSIETFKDNAIEVSNVLDPETGYNGRVTPARNALRWFNYIMQSLRTILPDSKLIFSSGEGNYVAKLFTTTCNIEGKALSESEDLDLTNFEDLDEAQPITFPELIAFDHPMNYNTFKRIKDDPTIRYKSFAYVCNGVESDGWLDIITYKPEQGMANISIIPKSTIHVMAPPEPACAAEVSNIILNSPGENQLSIDWTDSAPGATFWQIKINKDNILFLTSNYQSHPVTISGLPTGNYNVMVIPYCTQNLPGLNYVEGAFFIPPPPSTIIELSAQRIQFLFVNKFRITCVPDGGGNFNSSFSFKFGSCMTGAYGSYCASYPGAPIYPSNFSQMSGTQGQASCYADTYQSTSNGGTLDSIVIFDLVGITANDIATAFGETWTLVFL